MENPWDLGKKKTVFRNRSLGFLLLALIVTAMVALAGEISIDDYMEGWLLQLGEPIRVFSGLAVILGGTELIIGVSILIMGTLLLTGHQSWARFYLRLMFFGCFLAYVLKEGISRPRPEELISTNLWQLGTETVSQSFPSGHVMKITFLLVFLLVFYGVRKNAGRSPGILGVAGVLIALVGLEQILNGRHFFTDVVGGFFWAMAWSYGNLYVETRKKHKGIYREKNDSLGDLTLEG